MTTPTRVEILTTGRLVYVVRRDAPGATTTLELFRATAPVAPTVAALVAALLDVDRTAREWCAANGLEPTTPPVCTCCGRTPDQHTAQEANR